VTESKVFELHIESLVSSGEGLGFLDGIACFVEGALPGEVVRVEPFLHKRTYLKARVKEILTASKERVAPVCPLYGTCGGCNLQHLSYEGQLVEKTRLVKNAFIHAYKEGANVKENPSLQASLEKEFDAKVKSCKGKEPWGYRSRMKFHVGEDGKACLLQRGSTKTVKVTSCPVAVTSINSFLYGETDLMSCISKAKRQDLSMIKNVSSRQGSEDSDYGVLLFGTDDSLYIDGRDEYAKVDVAGEEIRFPVSGFFQSNLYMLDDAVNYAVDGLAGKRALDLYSGSGIFASALSKSFEEVVLVEEAKKSLDYARQNVNIKKCTFWPLTVERWLKESDSTKKFDAVIVDPPRSGLSEQVLTYLLKGACKTLRYVSCDPATLARDCKILTDGKYVLESVQPFDFFPQTTHVESVAYFTLK